MHFSDLLKSFNLLPSTNNKRHLIGWAQKYGNHLGRLFRKTQKKPEEKNVLKETHLAKEMYGEIGKYIDFVGRLVDREEFLINDKNDLQISIF